MATEQIKSLSGHYYGTYLQTKVSTYDRLVDRITYSLGYPMINIEVHQNQLYEYITMAAEMFSKYAGYTEEWLVFDSTLYEKGRGVRMDKLFSITPELKDSFTGVDLTINESSPLATNTTVTKSNTAAVYTFAINNEDDDPAEYAVKMTDTSTKHTRVSKVLVTSTFSQSGSVTYSEYGIIHTSVNDLLSITVATSGVSGSFGTLIAHPNASGTVTVIPNDYLVRSTGVSANQNAFASYDVLIDNYRKVMDVWSWEEGSTTGVNTLFTIEQTLAQQTYFSYSMGNYGFDLISWYVVKEFLDTRDKMLSQRRSYKFDARSQYLQMLPEPGIETFYGIVGCYVEKTLIELLKEPWVHQYALALTKIGVARARSKYTGTNLFGGGQLNYSELLSEGLSEKEKLETQLYEGASTGLGDGAPPQFFVG